MAKFVESAYQEAFCDGVEQADFDSDIVERAWSNSSTKETLEKLNKQNLAQPRTDVQAVFKNPEDGSEVHVSPEWMAECGTPITEAGDDMEYHRTEVESAKPQHQNSLKSDDVQKLIESGFDEGFVAGQANADYDQLFKLHDEATPTKGNLDCWAESETKDKMDQVLTPLESAFRPEHHVTNLVLSTRHYTLKDNELLSDAAINSEAAVYDLHTGFLIHIECCLGVYSQNFFSPELILLMKTAAEEGFDYIHFDRDAPESDNLPKFDW